MDRICAYAGTRYLGVVSITEIPTLMEKVKTPLGEKPHLTITFVPSYETAVEDKLFHLRKESRGVELPPELLDCHPEAILGQHYVCEPHGMVIHVDDLTTGRIPEVPDAATFFCLYPGLEAVVYNLDKSLRSVGSILAIDGNTIIVGPKDCIPEKPVVDIPIEQERKSALNEMLKQLRGTAYVFRYATVGQTSVWREVDDARDGNPNKLVHMMFTPNYQEALEDGRCSRLQDLGFG